MKTLCLDCSQNNITLAVWDDDNLLGFAHKENAQASLELLSELKILFEKTKTSLQDVAHVVYGCGPGSFTSLRIGSASLLGLFGFRSDVKFSGVPSLLLRLLSLHEDEIPKACLAYRARKGKVYCAWFEDGDYHEACLDDVNLKNLLEKHPFDTFYGSGFAAGQDLPVDSQAFLKILSESGSYKNYLKSDMNLNYLQPTEDVAQKPGKKAFF